MLSVEGGLVAAIKRDIERRAMDGLTVSLEVEEPPRVACRRSGCRWSRSRVSSG